MNNILTYAAKTGQSLKSIGYAWIAHLQAVINFKSVTYACNLHLKRSVSFQTSRQASLRPQNMVTATML
jgi:hypothetical protein